MKDGLDPPGGLPDAATRAQIGAADPSGSVWLAANAGSGKTRVLTNRVAWLLLEGTEPQRILCLTFTRAAAGEMQNRLFGTLGQWALAPDRELRRALRGLGVDPGRITPEQMRRARTLFARAIETPGGLKIQTIHAFASALLRRFPLEAGVSPAFGEMDETAAARLHSDLFDRMAEEEGECVAAVTRLLSDVEAGGFLAGIARLRHRFRTPCDEPALRAALGIGAGDCEASLREGCIDADHLDLLHAFRDLCRAASGKTAADLAALAEAAIVAAPHERMDLLCGKLLTKAGAPGKPRWPKAVAEGEPPGLLDAHEALCARLCETRARIQALGALEHALALHRFAPAFCRRLEEAKEARGWLDYDDMIERARHLLRDAQLAQWVLFKLDGGIDHILVDEAQDTSPDQWEIVTALAAEFGAGQGARDVRRTLFVVGDRKQSIYSFQGAEPDAFDRMRAAFGRMLEAGDAPLVDHELLHSFRSAPAILRAVDAVFGGGGGVGDPPAHIAFRSELPGRVDLWPVVEEPATEDEERVWHDPVDRPARNSAAEVLARRVAREIRAMLDGGAPITVREGDREVRRPVRPGDVLILFQRRRELFNAVIRACKEEGLDLAGADRLSLLDDLAVRDLRAALQWAVMPQDCLSLACLLRSPLGGLSEADLFALAHGRKGTLWRSLRESGRFEGVVAMLRDLLSVADYLRPYEMLERILTLHDGRCRLLGRLGEESAEAIDGLLHQALAYERLEVPSLTGFLGWLDAKAPEIKRESFRGAIRVMTVHGAKGLEAPVVILPETMARRIDPPSGVHCLPCRTPVWMPPKASWSPALHDLAEAWDAAQRAERDRLLYVAMTRAESWLIAGAAGKVGEAPQDSWWQAIRHGLLACGAQPLTLVERDGTRVPGGLRLESGDWAPAPAQASLALPDPVRLEPWARLPGHPPPAPRPAPLSPSELGGAKVLAGEHLDALEREEAMRRGSRVHRLLERLPALPRESWTEAAPRIAAEAAPLWFGDDPDEAWAEARAVLEEPSLAHLFAPGTLAEAPFSLPAVDGAPAFAGFIDRLVVEPGRVLVVDYKTNAAIPEAPEAIPEGLLRQMAAYRAAMRAVFPGRGVEAAILWTAERRLTLVPDPLLDAAWEGLLRTHAARAPAPAVDAPRAAS